LYEDWSRIGRNLFITQIIFVLSPWNLYGVSFISYRKALNKYYSAKAVQLIKRDLRWTFFISYQKHSTNMDFVTHSPKLDVTPKNIILQCHIICKIGLQCLKLHHLSIWKRRQQIVGKTTLSYTFVNRSESHLQKHIIWLKEPHKSNLLLK
jgi:hypothetical protein